MSCQHKKDIKHIVHLNNRVVSYHETGCMYLNNFLRAFSVQDTKAVIRELHRIQQYMNYLQKHMSLLTICSDDFLKSLKDLYQTYRMIAENCEQLVRLYMFDTSIDPLIMEHYWDSLVILMRTEDSLARSRFSKSQQDFAIRFNLNLQ